MLCRCYNFFIYNFYISDLQSFQMFQNDHMIAEPQKFHVLLSSKKVEVV